MNVKLLMIDDHPSMLEGYKIILSYNPFGYEVETTVAHNCEKAYELITEKIDRVKYDVVFLDYSLPAYKEKDIENGQDLALLIRKYLPKAKIVVLTSHIEAILLYNIVKSINPEGLLVKSDFTADELLVALDTVMQKKVYFSQTVKQIVKEVSMNPLYLDTVNRKIITLIAEGKHTKSIPAHLNLSLSAIEKRKVFIKEYLEVPKGNDEDIIRIAKLKGLV